MITSFIRVNKSSLQKLLIFVNLITQILEHAIDHEKGVKDWPLGLDILKFLNHSFGIESTILGLENTAISVTPETFHSPLSDLIDKK
jgi:hypothetical protein